MEVLARWLCLGGDGLGKGGFLGVEMLGVQSGAGIAEEAEASSPAQEAILEQALNARFQAEFN